MANSHLIIAHSLRRETIDSEGLLEMDYILSTAVRNESDFLIDGTTILEKLGHQYHMHNVRIG